MGEIATKVFMVRIPMKEIECSDPMSIRIRAQRSWQFHC